MQSIYHSILPFRFRLCDCLCCLQVILLQLCRYVLDHLSYSKTHFWVSWGLFSVVFLDPPSLWCSVLVLSTTFEMVSCRFKAQHLSFFPPPYLTTECCSKRLVLSCRACWHGVFLDLKSLFLHTWCWSLWPHCSIFVLSDQTTICWSTAKYSLSFLKLRFA